MPLALMLLGGLAGGALRYRTEKSFGTHSRRPTHWGPFTLNFSGSLLFGALSGWTYLHEINNGTALLGGVITAFSVCSCETVRLFTCGRHGTALLSAMGGWSTGMMAAATGVFLTV